MEGLVRGDREGKENLIFLTFLDIKADHSENSVEICSQLFELSGQSHN